MFQLIWSCISGFWDLLCQSLSPTNTSPTSDSHAMPSTTISQDPFSSVSDYVPSTTTSQAPSTSASIPMLSTTRSAFVSPSTPTQYDVFLSFRGSDTRLHFTGHLYDKLNSNGIRTFKDDPELRSGQVISDALLDAIRKSKSYIVVFSKNYASSSWCLDELVEIFNCHKAAKRLVIPVFYKIEPSVVRYQSQSFKEAFEKHQVRFEWEKVNQWRLALKQVADLSGSHISENKPEADVINEIVDELQLNINPKTLDVTKYPVGLDSRVNAIATLLSRDKKDVIKFGIYGMGGVGKTTLAKALFNQLVKGGTFNGSCFLANVRENSGTTKGLVSLQMQLINDVLSSKTKVKVHNVDQGIEFIEARTCSTKILVVIDDLDDLKQFQSLTGPFASESVVIITTRDEEILIKTEVEPRYRYLVNMLDDADSLALFMRHAFGNDEPNNTLLKLSKDILCLAGGLPLALEVFGSYLYKRSEEGWKYYIEKLHRNPNSSIQQRLVISLDALDSDDPDLKKIFLDVACCFNGWEKKYVVEIFKSYYSYADQCIDMLKKRCLLTIDQFDNLGMHDLLQDMGREIAHNNSRDEPGKHSRMWVTGDIHDVLKNHRGTEAIECIIFGEKDFPNEDKAYDMETFKRMSKLRFLYLNKVNLTGSFEHSLDDLRWLCWDWCALECLPSEFYPQKLVVLELPWSNIRAMWELNMVPHIFEKLKTLNMSYSRYLYTTPVFTVLPSLEILNLGGCESLEEVHVSIGSLVRLVSLNLSDCKKLKTLPDTIYNLRSLDSLIINGCEKLEILPDALWKITSLTWIDASYTTLLRKLPDIGSSQTALSLQAFELSMTGLTALPSDFSRLANLQYLGLNYCEYLKSIPTLPPNLKCIKAFMCESLERIANLSNLKQLEKLDLSYCRRLTYIEGLEELTCIRKLNLRGCSGLTYIQGLAGLASLTKLKLGDSLVPNKHLTKRLFQMYSEFGHQICFYFPEVLDGKNGPDWIFELPYWSNINSKAYADLLPTESPNFMGIVLCFERPEIGKLHHQFSYSVKNTASGFIWSDSLSVSAWDESLMVLVPKSILSITDDDRRIEFTADNITIVGIHLLYKTETNMIEDVAKKHVGDIDALKLADPVLQDIFLDIACFFIGWEVKEVVQILKTYYPDVNHNIDILKKRCLLTTNFEDKLEMNDLFQNMGRNIAHNNSPEDPGRHSRLWLSIDIYDVLKEQKGTEAIHSIIPRKLGVKKDSLEGESFATEAFKRMSTL